MPKRSHDQVDSSTAAPPPPQPREASMNWHKIPVGLAELCIDTTLRCGQSFRWRKSDDDVWSCALHGRLFSLRQDSSTLYYRVQGTPPTSTAANVTAAVAAKNGRARASAAAAAAAVAASTTKATPKTKKRKLATPLTPPVSHPDTETDDTKDADPSLSSSTLFSSSSSSSPTATTTRSFIADSDAEAFLRHYLNLTPNLSSLYAQWSAADKNFAAKAPRFTGVRILRQDAWEALVGFICSSNNNIARISQMMEKLCVHYGRRVGRAGDSSGDGGVKDFYDLPGPAALADPKVEAHLRELGFGYRAKYLYRTAAMIVNEKGTGADEESEETGKQAKGGKGAGKRAAAGALDDPSVDPEGRGLAWLDGLRNPEAPSFFSGRPVSSAGELPAAGGRPGYRAAHESLLSLQGVGPKVADCVCLMGLGWGESVPVDTHVWQIAVRDYRMGKGVSKHASMTKATYDAVADHFRALWGKEAGWAHSVLFTADLRQFAERLRKKIELTEHKTEVVVGRAKEEEEVEVEIKTEVQETVAAEAVEPASVAVKAEERELRNGDADGSENRTTIIEKKTTVKTTETRRRRSTRHR